MALRTRCSGNIKDKIRINIRSVHKRATIHSAILPMSAISQFRISFDVFSALASTNFPLHCILQSYFEMKKEIKLNLQKSCKKNVNSQNPCSVHKNVNSQNDKKVQKIFFPPQKHPTHRSSHVPSTHLCFQTSGVFSFAYTSAQYFPTFLPNGVIPRFVK